MTETATVVEVDPATPDSLTADESPRGLAVKVKYEIAAILERELGDNFEIRRSGLGPHKSCWFEATVGSFEVQVHVRPDEAPF